MITFEVETFSLADAEYLRGLGYSDEFIKNGLYDVWEEPATLN